MAAKRSVAASAADQGGLPAAGLWLPARAKRESPAETRPRASRGNAPKKTPKPQIFLYMTYSEPMRLPLWAKVFLGYLCIICLNAAYYIIIRPQGLVALAAPIAVSLAFGLIVSLTVAAPSRRPKAAADQKEAAAPADPEEQARLQRLAALGEAAMNLNHDINNPLMIIAGNAQILEADMETRPDAVKARARTIQDAAGRIGELVKKFRDVKAANEKYCAS